MTPKQLEECLRLGLIRPVRARVRKTDKGNLEQTAVEYELTHAGRVMMTQSYAAKASQYRRYHELSKKQQARKAAKEARALERQIARAQLRINLLKPRLG